MIQKEENTLLQKQGLESRRRVYLTPTAVIWEAGRVSGSKALLENRSVQVGLHNSDCCTLTNDGAAASILLDYGKELAGGLMLSVGTLCGAGWPRRRNERPRLPRLDDFCPAAQHDTRRRDRLPLCPH